MPRISALSVNTCPLGRASWTSVLRIPNLAADLTTTTKLLGFLSHLGNEDGFCHSRAKLLLNSGVLVGLEDPRHEQRDGFHSPVLPFDWDSPTLACCHGAICKTDI